MFTIYPIERIAEEYNESKNKIFIPFCDYLINSHQIGFNKEDKKIYINCRLDKWHNDKVADTFEQSLIEIINDSKKYIKEKRKKQLRHIGAGSTQK